MAEHYFRGEEEQDATEREQNCEPEAREYFSDDSNKFPGPVHAVQEKETNDTHSSEDLR